MPENEPINIPQSVKPPAMFTLPEPVEPSMVEEAQVAPPLWGGEEQEQPRPSILERGLERIGSAALEQPEKPANDMSDLFEVPQPEDNDIFVDDLLELDDEEDMEDFDDLSDLTKVEMDDIMGKPPRPRLARFKRTDRPYQPPTSMGGVG